MSSLEKITIKVFSDSYKGENYIDWEKFHIYSDSESVIDKVVMIEYETSSKLIREGYIDVFGTVYAHQEDSEYKDEVDINLDSVNIDLGLGDLVPYSLSDAEKTKIEEYILSEYSFENERADCHND
tara:strand:- start:264 stop:641 length:378 start_codon:yes stop_codon:yes gene_type:complete